MLCRVIRRFAYLLLLTASSLATSQELKLPDTPQILHVAPAPSDRFPAKWYTTIGDGTDVFPAPVMNEPHQATVEEMAPSRTLSGESLRHITRGFQARDRFGRTRRQMLSGGMTVGGQTVPTEVVIVSDPVSHCEFEWTQVISDEAMPPEMRGAIVTCGPQTLRYKDLNLLRGPLESAPDGITTSGGTPTKIEHLAPLQMDGLAVNRMRVTNSHRADNGDATRWSIETWYSLDLEEIIRIGDEENGYPDLVDIRRDDPEPKLFYPPDGYDIELKAQR